jgi:GAF domain-containing protein
MSEADKYKKRYQILQDISHAIVITDRISSLTDYLLDVSIRYVDAESGSLMLVNERGNLSILSSRGLDLSYIRSFSSQGGDGISGIILRDRVPILVQDIAQHPELLSPDRHHYKTRSFISCPILFQKRLLGIINVNDKKDRTPFTRDELELLQIIANNAAVALENASLLNRLKSAAAELEQMNRRLVDSDIIKTEFLTSISHELRTPLNAIKGGIYYLENRDEVSPNERREFHCIISTEANNLANTIDNFVRFLEVEDETLVLDKYPINIDEILQSLPAAGHLNTVLTKRSVRFSVLPASAPLWIFGDKLRINQLFTNLLIGLTHFLSPDDAIELSVSSTDDLLSFHIILTRPLPRSLLQQLNSDTSLLPSGSSDDRIRISLARNIVIAHRWSISAESGNADTQIVITCPLNRKEILNAYISKSIDLFVDYITESLDINICSVMLSDDLSGELRVASARGLDEKIVKTTRIKQGDKIAGWVALEGKPLFISNIETDARFSKKNIPQYNNTSLMSLPLKVDDRVIGVLNLNNKKSSEPFSQEDYDRALSLLDSFSDHLRQAYEKQLNESEIFQLIASLDSNLSCPFRTLRPPH